MNPANTTPPDFTVSEVCTIFGVTPPVIYKLLNRGDLIGYKVGRARRITRESVDRVRAGKAGAA